MFYLNDGDCSLYHGGHPIENAQVDHKFFDASGTEILMAVSQNTVRMVSGGELQSLYLESFLYSVIIDSQTESGEYMQFTWIILKWWNHLPTPLEDNQGNSLISGNHESGRATFDYISAGIPPGT